MIPTACGHQQMSMPHAVQIVDVVIESLEAEKINDDRPHNKLNTP